MSFIKDGDAETGECMPGKRLITVDVVSDPNWYWAWPSKRRIEAVIAQFKDKADFKIRFQPFQLYPDLPSGDDEGVDKRDFFQRLTDQRNPGKPEEEKRARRVWLKDAWAADGLQLNFSGDEVRPSGRLGNSFDAQRLIAFARKQGREDDMIEAIYTANHVNNQCLSDWRVLLEAAEQAGVEGAAAMLASNEGKKEVAAKIEGYRQMGINAVPVVVIDDKFPIMGAPEKAVLAQHFEAILDGTQETGINGIANTKPQGQKL